MTHFFLVVSSSDSILFGYDFLVSTSQWEKRWFRVHEFNKSDMGHCFRIYCMFRNFLWNFLLQFFFYFISFLWKAMRNISGFFQWEVFVLDFLLCWNFLYSGFFFVLWLKSLVNNGYLEDEKKNSFGCLCFFLISHYPTAWANYGIVLVLGYWLLIEISDVSFLGILLSIYCLMINPSGKNELNCCSTMRKLTGTTQLYPNFIDFVAIHLTH